MPSPRYPQAHQLYHERQYPPYSPPVAPHVDHISRIWLWAAVVLLVIAFAGLWGMSGAPATRWSAQTEPSVAALQPSEAAAAQDLEPDESGFRPAPTRSALTATPAEQELTRQLAELNSQMMHIKRLARAVGQQEAFSTFEGRHEALIREVAEREIPWRENDRARLEQETRRLSRELTKFSNELEEVATVQI